MSLSRFRGWHITDLWDWFLLKVTSEEMIRIRAMKLWQWYTNCHLLDGLERRRIIENGKRGMQKRRAFWESDGARFEGKTSVLVSESYSKTYLPIGCKPQGWRDHERALEGWLLFIILVKSARGVLWATLRTGVLLLEESSWEHLKPVLI